MPALLSIMVMAVIKSGRYNRYNTTTCLWNRVGAISNFVVPAMSQPIKTRKPLKLNLVAEEEALQNSYKL